MQKTTTMVLGLAIMCTVLLTFAEGQEQQTKDPTDLTGRLDVTCLEIAQGLGLRASCGRRAFLPQVASPGRIDITIPFDFNSSGIKQDAVPNLQSMGQALAAPDVTDRIRIVGHTDSIGRNQYNLRLSEYRAQSVKQYLVDNFHIAVERLLVAGRGAQEPIAANTTKEGREKNRRVELVNLERQKK